MINILLAANRSNTNAQLSLALAWNRPDIAKNEIFKASNKTNYQVTMLLINKIYSTITSMIKHILNTSGTLYRYL